LTRWSKLLNSIVQENLIDEYWLFVNPVIIGNGISLFHRTRHDIKLKLLKSFSFANGVTCLHNTNEV
jgi:riboflavin biosynthesis pyrimidine reductase